MELLDYYKDLSGEDRAAFAKRAETTANYLTSHIMKPRPKPIRGATIGFISRLAEATGGKVSLHEVLAHFEGRNFSSGSDEKKVA